MFRKILNFLIKKMIDSMSAVLIAIWQIFSFNSKAVFDQSILFYGFISLIVVLNANLLNLCSLFNSSNHIILTLDILAIFSLLILVLYHIFKEPENFSISNL